MSYATPADVKACFRNFTTNQTNAAITDTKIQQWLDGASAKINSRISVLYEMPIIGAASLSILKDIETFFVAGIVDDILNSYSDGQKKPMWEKRAADMLADYAPLDKKADPAAIFPDATYLGTKTQRSQFKASNTIVEPIFKKGENNW